MKHSKRYQNAWNQVESRKVYSLEEGVNKVKETSTATFDESVELSVRLGVDPRKSDQMVRGTVVLPHGTGKTVKVLVLTKGSKENEAKEAGADYVGGDDMIKKIQEESWIDYDVVIATPDIMGQVGRLGKVLGPRGLMPNAKSGTVTMDIEDAVKDVKAGKISFRVDRYGIVHVAVGKGSFSVENLKENVNAFMDTINKLRPVSAKGIYVRSIFLSSTMGPSIRIDKNQLIDVPV
ncbi:50S ribosomal protein L1 [candidate division KSB1 bacterium]|nr:50S ribosomal protein L1 [candidate division KSB1 bacterium]